MSKIKFLPLYSWNISLDRNYIRFIFLFFFKNCGYRYRKRSRFYRASQLFLSEPQGDSYIFRTFLRKEDGVVICKVTLSRICILKLDFFRSWCVFEEGYDLPFIFLTYLFYRYSVFYSEAGICLGFSQIKPQNMLFYDYLLTFKRAKFMIWPTPEGS